jgi:RND family efflux transporter MFP subunit
MNRTRNAVIAGVAIVAVVVAGIFSRGSGPKPVIAKLFAVHRGTFQTTLPETGVIALPEIVTVPAGVAGTLEKISVHAGERVAQSQTLATILNDQILNSLSDADATASSAHGKAQSIAETNAVLPEQNHAAVLQAEANLVAARSQLTQAKSDLVSGSQSGLGYGGTTAEEQRLAADSTVAKASTDLSEAKRTYEADQYIYEQKGLSNDALLQAKARYDEAKVTYDQSVSERRILGGTLSRNVQLLRDRVRSAQDAVSQATAALESARANAAESKAGDLQAARADAQRADADREYAAAQAAKLNVRAPIAGVVESVATETGDSLRPLQPGDAITVGQTLFTLSSGDAFIVRTKVDEQDVAGLRLGQQAVVSGEDFGGAKLTGTVIAISPVAQKSDDPSNTSRQVVTTIALTKRLPYLRDGMTVDVDISTHDERGVIAIPNDAIRKDDAKSYVYVVRSGKAHRVDIKTGASSDTQTIVTSGLAPGDTIVADKKADVDENTRVDPMPSASPGTSSPKP